MPTTRCATILLVLAGLGSASAAAQRAQTPPDSAQPARAYRDLTELLAALPAAPPPVFDESSALWLGSLPLACLDRLQPRPGQNPARAGGAPAPAGAARAGDAPADSARADSTNRASGPAGGPGRGALTGADYFWIPSYRLIPNYKTTRAFWGCNDWQSAVSSTWVTARLLREYPQYALRELAREKLGDHLGKSNLEGEFAFFRGPAGTFQRPYGYAWLMKLQAELRASPDSQARQWAANTAPLAAWMADSLVAYMSALQRPVRSGTTANTAFMLSLALDYADARTHARVHTALRAAAVRLYPAERKCAIEAETAASRMRAATGRAGGATPPPVPAAPGATDLLSPCLAEAALAARVVAPAAFAAWLTRFLPAMESAEFAPLRDLPAAAATGNERVRLAALAFQRAHAFEWIARGLPVTDARQPVLQRLSALHGSRAFELMRADTQGGHWLPAFALLYITSRRPSS